MRVSVTDVDGFEYFLNAETLSVEDIVRRTLRLDPPTYQMSGGKAFHALLEHAQDGDVFDEVESEGEDFEFALNATIALPPVRELKAEYPMSVDGVDITLVGKVDTFNGWRVDDHKLASKCDVERYQGSFQWRAYLLMFGAEVFRYNVFTGSKLQSGVWRVRHFDAFQFTAYPRMQDDVYRSVARYLEFYQTHIESAAA